MPGVLTAPVPTEPALLNKIRVGIIDSETFFRGGITAHLSAQCDMEVVGETAALSDAIKFASELATDVLIVDLKNTVDAFNLIGAIKGSGSRTKIMAISVSEDSNLVMSAVRTGADGYALKSVNGQDLVNAIRMVNSGQRYVTPSLAYALLRTHEAKQKSERTQRDQVAGLTPRERDVLTVLVEGRSNKEIGRRLDLSEKTVKHHVTSILQKLKARNRVEAVLMVARQPAKVPATLVS
jgi:two-component system, NarL family, nitrate/nitrite response regulator NarL